MQDAERTYSQVELEALSENLLALVDSVYRGEFSLEPASRGLLCEFHRRAFDKVRDFAGLNRNQNYGNDYLNYYGNLRSPHKGAVPGVLDELLERTERKVRQLLEYKHAENFEYEALKLSVKTHADIVSIQPFQDGNKRTSRLFMNYILIRLGMRPIIFEIPREEYAKYMRHYFISKEIDPLLLVVIDLYEA